MILPLRLTPVLAVALLPAPGAIAISKSLNATCRWEFFSCGLRRILVFRQCCYCWGRSRSHFRSSIQARQAEGHCNDQTPAHLIPKVKLFSYLMTYDWTTCFCPPLFFRCIFHDWRDECFIRTATIIGFVVEPGSRVPGIDDLTLGPDTAALRTARGLTSALLK